ncbi:MAG: hypothetical protein GTO02_15950, partial [Candidatus Dadabacteria bacterium]|nr:hypothetical protein [Candidatus Dadabacteria bacterium]
VSMTNTSYELLEFMQNEFGGYIYLDKMPRNKTTWQWAIFAKAKVANFAKTILPFLREKRKIRRGKVLLEFCCAVDKNEKLNLMEKFFNC